MKQDEITKKKIYFVQSGMAYGKAHYLPYATGCIAAYAFRNESVNSSYELADFLFKHEPIDLSLERIKNPHIVCFSAYVWNFEYNKALAKAVKEKYPACLIIFGGHSIPENTSFLIENDYVDILIHGEGEETFYRLLQTFDSNSPLDTVKNISFKSASGEYVKTEYVCNSKLDDYPSPYLEGLFDKYLEKGESDEFLYIIETNRGCPYACAYCDWSHSTDLRLFPMEKIKQELDWLADHKAEYVFCADANFGILKRDYEIAEEVVSVRKAKGYPLVFNGCYAKNSNDTVFEISKLFYENKANKAATLAYQSLNSLALENVNRKNFPPEGFSLLLYRYNKAGIPTYTELILGLPGETYESFTKGLCELIELGQHTNTTVYPCQIYPNTVLDRPDFIAKHAIKSAHMPLNRIRFKALPSKEITEYIDVVVETSTMSFEEMSLARTFSVCVMCFHHIGLLRFFAMFLRHEHGIAYLDFYNKLLDYIFSADGSLLKDLFDRIHRSHKDTASGEWTYFDPRFGEIGWYYEEGAFLELIYNYKLFIKEIKPFLDSFGISKDIYEELISYQFNVIRLPGDNDIEINLGYDFYEYFKNIQTNNYQRLEEKVNKINIRLPLKVYGWVEYAQRVMLFAKRRGDTVLTNNKDNIKITYM